MEMSIDEGQRLEESAASVPTTRRSRFEINPVGITLRINTTNSQHGKEAANLFSEIIARKLTSCCFMDIDTWLRGDTLRTFRSMELLFDSNCPEMSCYAVDAYNFRSHFDSNR